MFTLVKGCIYKFTTIKYYYIVIIIHNNNKNPSAIQWRASAILLYKTHPKGNIFLNDFFLVDFVQNGIYKYTPTRIHKNAFNIF